jgi:hypothetical protein
MHTGAGERIARVRRARTLPHGCRHHRLRAWRAQVYTAMARVKELGALSRGEVYVWHFYGHYMFLPGGGLGLGVGGWGFGWGWGCCRVKDTALLLGA